MKRNDIQRMISALAREGEQLFDRHTHANKRADRLGQAANDYDNATIETQTPEECSRLDRMIEVSNRARLQAERLEERRNLVMDACSDLEEVVTLSKPSLIKPLHAGFNATLTLEGKHLWARPLVM